MRKVLFVVCTHGNELAGHKLFQDYPYGQTDKVEWEIVIGNPEAVMMNTRFTETDLNRSFDAKVPRSYEEKRAEMLKQRFKQYDEVYDIHTTQRICPSSWDDSIFVNNTSQDILNMCQWISSPHIIWDSDSEYSKRYLTFHHPRALTLEYQKTYDVYADYERILCDFENIIHREKPRHQEKRLYEADRAVTQEEQVKYHLEFEDFHPIAHDAKKHLGLKLNEEYVPVFVNPPETDPKYYCFLNRKVKDL